MNRIHTIIYQIGFIVSGIVISVAANAQLNAEFTVNANSGCAPLLVQFTDQSTGNPVSWNWTLGTTNSTAQNPSVAYTSGGVYTICLTVTDINGNQDTECKNNFINIFDVPIANLQATPSTGCIPLDVQFTDVSVTGSGNINTWFWSFGDGQTATTQNPNHTYNTPGTYNVILTVTDDNGCTNTLSQNAAVTVNAPPSASFTASGGTNCNVPQTINFTNTTPSTGNPISYFWNFGDGTPIATFVSPNHIYNNAGLYTVTLIAEDDVTGCRDTTTVIDAVQIGSRLKFGFSPQTVCGNNTVTFTDSSGNTSNWLWDFGDGNTSTLQNPTHTYASAGCYTVSFTATLDGCSSTITHNCIQVFDDPVPAYTINSPLQSCDTPHVVSFTDNSLNTVSWVWDFGDGDSAFIQNPTHTYTTFGNFPVALTVTSSDGCVVTLSTDTIQVQAVDAQIDIDSDEGCVPLTIAFMDNSSSLFPITSWEWDFGTGDVSSMADPVYTYTDTGSFTVTLIVTNTQGCTDTLVRNNFINTGIPPTMNFSASPTTSCAGDTVFFTNTSSTFAGLWSWDFGDSTAPFVGRNAFHVYQDTGNFDVTLIGEFNGCFNTLTQNDLIHVPVPRAIIGIERVCENPFDIRLINNSIMADSVFWDFGIISSLFDTSSLDTIDLTYFDRGNYTISLTAFNDSTGCSHTQTSTIAITTPEADFTISPLVGCAPLDVIVTDTSLDANIYQWIAPGASISDTAAAPTLTYNNAGLYTDIGLVITDVNNCKDTLQLSDTIRVSDVFPNFGYTPVTGCTPLSVTFTDSSSTFLGNLTGWNWDFGDMAGTSTLQNPNYTYPVNGQFDVSLTVSNSLGCSRTFTDSMAILATFPTANFVVDTFNCTDNPLIFANTSTGIGMNFHWDFGNGDTSILNSPTYSYANEGTYSVCLTVTDLNGCQDIMCQNITIANPIANFGVDTTTTPCFNLTVQFSDSSENAVAWFWDFGNGTTSNIQNPLVTYPSQGNFDVCLVVTSASGCTDTICKPSLININSPSGTMSIDTTNGCPPLDVTFSTTGINVLNFVWVFDDGNIVTQPGTGGFDTIDIVHSYQNGGVYHPILFVESVPGCQQSIALSDSISVELFDVDFTMSDSLICGAGTINLASMISSTLPIDTFYWNVSGGNLSSTTAANPSIVFTTPGLYDVTLFASDGTCDRSTTKSIIVASTPQVDFTYTGGLLCHPQTVEFTDQSISTVGTITNYDWTFTPIVSSTLPDPTHTFGAPGLYDVQLIVGNEHGCIDSLTQTLTIEETPVADAGQDVIACRNEEVQLTGTGGGTYAWSNGFSLNCQTCPDPIATPNVDTDYILTVTSAAGCTDTDTVTVSLTPFQAPTVTVSNDTTMCIGDTIQLFAFGSNDVLDYQWDTRVAGLSCYTGCSNPFAFPTTTTTYYVTLTGEGGCTDTDSITVTVLQSNPNILGDDITICAGESIQLQTLTGANHQWSPSVGLSCVFCPDPIVTPQVTTQYIVTALNALACPITDTITINVFDPAILGAGDDKVVCPGESIQLDATVTGVYSWAADPTLSDPNAEDPIASPTTTTTYYLTIDNGNCIITDSVTVFVTTKATIFAEDVTICEGDSVQLMTQGMAQSFTWLPADGLDDPTSGSPMASPTATTTYTVIGAVGTCDADSTEVTVTVVPAPIITGFPIQNVFPAQTVALQLDVEVNPTFTYTWLPDVNDINCLNCPSPIIVANEDSIVYTVTATNLAGCSTSDSIQILFVNDCSEDLIIVPNGFTPNGDGLNDVLYVRSSAITEINVFRIFARDGELIFTSSNLSSGWDGTYNGQIANPGVFVYYVEAICPATGNIIQKRGNVTLIR